MRHVTDADHVLAISTIVSRERSLRGAAAIGALWGVGHGVTVAIVGCLIILFGVVIPPRIGLAMGFAVGVMLVLLGLFTLAAVARQAREALALHLLHGAQHGAPVHADAIGHVLPWSGRLRPASIPAPLIPFSVFSFRLKLTKKYK